MQTEPTPGTNLNPSGGKYHPQQVLATEEVSLEDEDCEPRSRRAERSDREQRDRGYY